MSHTARQYGIFQDAYDHFNRTLWLGNLPPCLITLQRKGHARGFFRGDGFIARQGEEKIDEIALNPDCFNGRTDREILSTLVHEMAHLWHHHFGTPGRRGYHNAEWADEMERIGLMPSNTGAPGGNRTGQKVSHFVITGRPFDVAAVDFLANRQAVVWNGTSDEVTGRLAARMASAKSKSKFSCPVCGQSAWARPGAQLACVDHAGHPELPAVIMLPIASAVERDSYRGVEADPYDGVERDPYI